MYADRNLESGIRNLARNRTFSLGLYLASAKAAMYAWKSGFSAESRREHLAIGRENSVLVMGYNTFWLELLVF